MKHQNPGSINSPIRRRRKIPLTPTDLQRNGSFTTDSDSNPQKSEKSSRGTSSRSSQSRTRKRDLSPSAPRSLREKSLIQNPVLSLSLSSHSLFSPSLWFFPKSKRNETLTKCRINSSKWNTIFPGPEPEWNVIEIHSKFTDMRVKFENSNGMGTGYAGGKSERVTG